MTWIRVAAAVLVAASAAACTSGRTPDPSPSASRTPRALPTIATDPCPAPADLLASVTGGESRLADLTLPCLGAPGTVRLRTIGRVPTVVNLWASWCEPCREEMPEFQRIYAAAAGRVRFLGVNTRDDPGGARRTVQHTGISYPSVVDAQGRLRASLRAVGMPVTVLVDERGTVVFRQDGPVSSDELRAAIRKHTGIAL